MQSYHSWRPSHRLGGGRLCAAVIRCGTVTNSGGTPMVNPDEEEEQNERRWHDDDQGWTCPVVLKEQEEKQLTTTSLSLMDAINIIRTYIGFTTSTLRRRR